MKVFLDTNIFVEFISRRKQYEQVCQIIDAIIGGEYEAFISMGGLYTLTYIFERDLKKQEIHRPELTQRLRGYLAEVLNMATMVSFSHTDAVECVYDEAFCDLEDSFQYRCALENNCDVLVTINIKDYRQAGQADLEILTPTGFVEKYLHTKTK